jgi:telomeric repeat-binding factor 2-interacting protein 1
MASKQQTKATIQHPTPQPPEVVVPHEPLVEKRKSPPRREAPPSPKKAKITTQQSEEAAVNQEPVGGASMGIDNFFLELPFLPPSPSAEEEAPEQDIESWIDNRRREGKGNEAQIIEALRCTSMDPTLADQILESIAAGNGIPADMRGVWTAEDDRTLEARDTREIQRLMDKHGSVCLDYRWEYLNMARAEGLE